MTDNLIVLTNKELLIYYNEIIILNHYNRMLHELIIIKNTESF